MDELTLLKGRFNDLCNRADNKYCYTNTEFLNLNEQNILHSCIPQHKYILDGGYFTAERKIAIFGNEEDFGYPNESPIRCIEIKPLQQKFADKLTHRDFLGALMSLGIKRETLGDIIISENKGYLFCLDAVSNYIIENCISIKHTSVSCCLVDSPPDESVKLPEQTEVVTASLRCDAVISSVYNLSRSECKRLFDQELVFINSVCVKSASSNLSEGDIVSVRGKGRFIFDGEKTVTKKNKLRVLVKIFK